MPDPNQALSSAPPSNLAALKPLLERVEGTWYRVTQRRFCREVHYFSDRTSNRFSSPSAAYGVSYYGATPEAAFAESVRDSALIDHNTLNGPVLEGLDLHEIKIIEKVPEATDNLAITLAGQGAAQIRFRGELANFSKPDGYRISQEWARALMEHPVEHCGLVYLGNYAQAACLGLYGKKGGKGARVRKAKGLELKKGRCIPLMNSHAFRLWVEDCSYSIDFG